MCGRLSLHHTEPLKRLFHELGLTLPPEAYNVAPTEAVWTLIHGEESPLAIVPMRWWLTPSWAPDITPNYSMFNARSDRVLQSRAFKAPFQRRRCLIPVGGFFEWKTEGKAKQPWLIEAVDEPLLLGGIWDCWDKGGEGPFYSFSILTTKAVPEFAWLHDRMPVMIRADEMATWVDPNTSTEEAIGLTQPRLAMPLRLSTVGKGVGNSRNKAAETLHAEGESIVIKGEV